MSYYLQINQPHRKTNQHQLHILLHSLIIDNIARGTAIDYIGAMASGG